MGFVGSSLGDSSKESGSTLGTRWEITGEKTRRLVVSMPEVTGLAEVRSEGGWTTRTTESGLRPVTFGGSTARVAVKPLVPHNAVATSN
ncbi:hypothetical protein BHM03_00057623 [Ensete ventricosum]|nr:hypothetical protein BHM03_00057623 [Ensete ventricosum]